MTLVFDELNKDQLSGLANLAFDLSKLSFAFVLLPTDNISNDITQLIISKIITTLIGLALMYVALIILKLKEKAIK